MADIRGDSKLWILKLVHGIPEIYLLCHLVWGRQTKVYLALVGWLQLQLVSFLLLSDRSKATRFLVHSGSVVSHYSETIHRQATYQKKSRATGSQWDVYYHLWHLPSHVGPRPFHWPFIIANVNTAILGADAFKHYGLVIALRHRRLLDGLTSLSTICTLTVAQQIHIISAVLSQSTPFVGQN